jgi:hypothetical protein
MYIFHLFFFGVVKYHEVITVYANVLQIVFATFFFFFLYYIPILKLNIKVVLLLVFLYSLVFSFVLRYCFIDFTSNIFGPAVSDSYFYHSFAMNVMRKDLDYFVMYLTSQYKNIDDYGFPTILYIIYTIAGTEASALNLTLLFNTLAITLSTYFLYKLLILLRFQAGISCFLSACWGLFPFLFVIAAVGLKENFFCLFILLSFYYMYKYKKQRRISSLVLSFMGIICTYFFRIAIPFMIIISFVILIMANSKWRKNIFIVLFILLIAGTICMKILFSYIFPVSLESLLFRVIANRANGISNNLIISFAVLIATSLIGPFPNFSNAIQDGGERYWIVYNSALLFKVIVSFYILVGIWRIIKTYNFRYYSILAYIGMGLLLLVLSGVALDMRYQITFYPIMIPIIAYAFKGRKISNLLYSFYIIVSSGLVILYNIR